MNSDYDKALEALEKFKKTKETPEKFDPNNEELTLLAGQLDALAAEHQDDIDNARQALDEIEKFEQEWDKKSWPKEATEGIKIGHLVALLIMEPRELRKVKKQFLSYGDQNNIKEYWVLENHAGYVDHYFIRDKAGDFVWPVAGGYATFTKVEDMVWFLQKTSKIDLG